MGYEVARPTAAGGGALRPPAEARRAGAMPRAGRGRGARRALALAALAAAGAAGALSRGARGAGGATRAGAEFPCDVRVQGRGRGDPECTTTVWRVPRAEAQALGLKRRTVFRSCPSKRAQRRARRGKTQLAAGNLPGGDDKVLAGFEEGSVTKSGFLWSAVTYDDAGAPTMAVLRDADSTLVMAERAPVGLEGRRRRRGGPGNRTRMVCRTGTDRTLLTGVTDVVLPASEGPEGTVEGGFAASETCPGTPTALVNGVPVTRPHTQVRALFEVDRNLIEASYGSSAAAARSEVNDILNLVSANFWLQTGILLEAEVYIDSRAGELGHLYPPTGKATDALGNFRTRWNSDEELNEKMQGYGVISLLSGQDSSQGGNFKTIGIARLNSACRQGQGKAVFPAAINWLTLANNKECAVSLIMHELGHTFSAQHHDYTESAVMHSMVGNHCSQSFLPVVRDKLSAWVDRYTDGVGCACATSPGPELTPPAPEPEPPAPETPLFDCLGLRPRSCRAARGCVKMGRRGCSPTRANGGVCGNIPKKGWCRKAGCLWGPAVVGGPDEGEPVAATGAARRARRRRRGGKSCQDFDYNAQRAAAEGN